MSGNLVAIVLLAQERGGLARHPDDRGRGRVGEPGRREEEAAQLEMIRAITPEERRSYIDLMTRLAHWVKAKQGAGRDDGGPPERE